MYKEFKLIQLFNKNLVELINYIDNSPKKIKILKDKQKELEFENIYQLLKAKEIRWNSFLYATNRVRLLYPAIHNAVSEFISIAPTKTYEKIAISMRDQYIKDFNFLFLMHWLSDFLQPICSLNKHLQSESYQLAMLEDEITDIVTILDVDYINFDKPLLNDLNNVNEELIIEEMMKHHLSFGGFYLKQFLSNCTFIDKTTVRYKYFENKETTLDYTKLTAIELKFLVTNASKFLKKELLNLIPGEKTSSKILKFSTLKVLIC